MPLLLHVLDGAATFDSRLPGTVAPVHWPAIPRQQLLAWVSILAGNDRPFMSMSATVIRSFVVFTVVIVAVVAVPGGAFADVSPSHSNDTLDGSAWERATADAVETRSGLAPGADTGMLIETRAGPGRRNGVGM